MGKAAARFTVFGLVLGLLTAATPALAHALLHAVTSPFEHSHDGGPADHLHSEHPEHETGLELLPPGLAVRRTADFTAPGCDCAADSRLFTRAPRPSPRLRHQAAAPVTSLLPDIPQLTGRPPPAP